jgi:hypothetical protein
MKKPNISDSEFDQAKSQFDRFESQVNSLTLDRMNETPKQEVEPQTKLSQHEIEKSKDIYIKPKRSIGSREKFNEDYREQYNFSKEYVQFIAENKELTGENIDIWTKPFPGMPAEEWCIPSNKPIWAPRYVAEQIKRKFYHRLRMDDKTIVSQDGHGSYTGAMVVDTTIARLDAYPVSSRRSVFV